MSDNYFYIGFPTNFVHNSMIVFEGLNKEDCIESSTLQVTEDRQVQIQCIAHGVHVAYLFDCNSDQECMTFATTIQNNLQKLLVDPSKVICVTNVRLWGILKTLQK